MGLALSHRWKLLSLGIVLAMAFVVLAGCGGKKEAPASPTAAAAAGDTSEEVVAAPEIERVPIEEVKALLDKGAAVAIIDTRFKGDYDERHIPTAISAPLSDLERGQKPDIPLDKPIIAYCT